MEVFDKHMPEKNQVGSRHPWIASERCLLTLASFPYAGLQIGVVADTTPVTEQDLLFLGPKVRVDAASARALRIAVSKLRRWFLVQGTITDQGIADNLSVGLAYLESWLRGIGCVPLHNLVCSSFGVVDCASSWWICCVLGLHARASGICADGGRCHRRNRAMPE